MSPPALIEKRKNACNVNIEHWLLVSNLLAFPCGTKPHWNLGVLYGENINK
jgi:hypothetical protein